MPVGFDAFRIYVLNYVYPLFSFNSKEEDIQNTFSKVKAEYLNKAEPEIHIISHLSLLFNYGFLKNIFYCFDNVS